MFLALSIPIGVLCVPLAGCCSTDPAGLSDPDPDVRRERLACMGEAAVDDPQDREATRAAKSAALRAIDPSVEEHAGVRATGHRVIEELRLVDAAPAVATRLVGGADQDPSAVVRAAAASALGALGGEVAVDALRQALLRDPASDVRAAAARELGDLDDESSLTTEALVEALRDEAGVVRLNARRALRQIHGADLGLDPRTWRLWLDARARGEPAPPAPDDGAGEVPYEYPFDGDDRPSEGQGVEGGDEPPPDEGRPGGPEGDAPGDDGAPDGDDADGPR